MVPVPVDTGYDNAVSVIIQEAPEIPHYMLDGSSDLAIKATIVQLVS